MSDLSIGEAAFNEELRELRTLLDSYRVRPGFYLGDIPLFLHSQDVCENCNATLILRDSAVGRTAFAVARAAFEAALEMALLAMHESGYLHAGADMTAYSHCDTENLRTSWAAVLRSVNPLSESLDELGTADEEIDRDIEFLNKHSPTESSILRAAYDEMRRKYKPKNRVLPHWSGLSSVHQRIHKIENVLAAIGMSEELVKSMYSMMSVHTHPSLTLRNTEQELNPATGRLKTISQDNHSFLLVSFAYIAARMASYVLRKRDSLTCKIYPT